MYLDELSATILYDFGFQKKELKAGDFYCVAQEEWIVGGAYGSCQDLLIPSYVLEKGICCPSLADVWLWLEQNTDNIELSYERRSNVPVFFLDAGIGKTRLKAKGAVMTNAFFKMALKILLHLQQKPATDRTINCIVDMYVIKQKENF